MVKNMNSISDSGKKSMLIIELLNQQIEQQKLIADSVFNYRKRAIEQVEIGIGLAGAHFADLLKQAYQNKANGNIALSEQFEQEAIYYRDNIGWKDYATEVNGNHGIDEVLYMIQTKFISFCIWPRYCSGNT